MSCRYEGDNNRSVESQVEQCNEAGEWRPLVIGNDSPGFLIFVYSLLSCQHLYMVLNAAERGLLLERAEGHLELVGDQGWMLQTLKVAFTGRLRSGTPTAEDIAYIEQRMNQCPVSRNIHAAGAHTSTLVLQP